jgi:hypothetical protein
MEQTMPSLFTSLRRLFARKARRPQGSTVRLEPLELEPREVLSGDPQAFSYGSPIHGVLTGGNTIPALPAPGTTVINPPGSPFAGTLSPTPTPSAPAPAPTTNANQVFLATAYELLLNHPIDQAGLTYWYGQLATLGRSGVLQQILQSAEERQAHLQGIYQYLLQRAPGSADLGYWQSQMSAGLTSVQGMAAVLGSDEFFARAGGTNWNFLDRLYLLEMGRHLDEAGRVYWGTALAQGASRADVAEAVLDSPEARSDAVADMVARLLGHSAGAAALGYWTQFSGPGAQDQVLAGLLGSAEFLGRLQRIAGQQPASSQSDPNALASGFLQQAFSGSPAAATSGTISSEADAYYNQYVIISNVKGTYHGTITGQGTNYGPNGHVNPSVAADITLQITDMTPNAGGGYTVHGNFTTGLYANKSISGDFTGLYVLTQEPTTFQDQEGTLQFFWSSGSNSFSTTGITLRKAETTNNNVYVYIGNNPNDDFYGSDLTMTLTMS